MAVLGYNPTEEELAAIRRGEDPRAGEASRKAGARPEKAPAEAETAPEKQAAGPAHALVLRWFEAGRVSVEVEGRRLTVLIQKDEFASEAEAARALDLRMTTYTYGTRVKLTYPVRDAQGNTVFRDAQGNLLAIIE